MTGLEAIVAEITAQFGPPTQWFRKREIGIAVVSGWIWVKANAPYGLRVERIGADRHTVRAWQHTTPGRRAELICPVEPTDVEVRAVCTMAGLLPDWGRS